jgi:hypothetical protein
MHSSDCRHVHRALQASYWVSSAAATPRGQHVAACSLISDAPLTLANTVRSGTACQPHQVTGCSHLPLTCRRADDGVTIFHPWRVMTGAWQPAHMRCNAQIPLKWPVTALQPWRHVQLAAQRPFSPARRNARPAYLPVNGSSLPTAPPTTADGILAMLQLSAPPATPCEVRLLRVPGSLRMTQALMPLGAEKAKLT